MCLVELYTDIYPREIRTRKIIRRCLLSDGKETCNHTWIHDYGESHHTRNPQTEDTQHKGFPMYSRVQATDQKKSDEFSNTASGRKRLSKIPERRFTFNPPFLRRSHDPDEPQATHTRRGRARSPRPFVVDFPEDTGFADGDTEEPSYTQVRYGAPNAEVPSISHSQQRSDSLNPSPHSPRVLQTSQPRPRPARERTPVVEREPRRRRPSVPVEIHNSRTENRATSGTWNDYSHQGSPTFRRVRFSTQADSNETTNGTQADVEAVGEKVPGSRENIHRWNSIAGHGRNEYEKTEDGARYRRRSRERRSLSISPGPRVERVEAQRPSPIRRANSLRPQVIQDGHRQISEAGGRILGEAQMRQSRASFLRDFWFRPRSRSWIRTSDRRRTYTTDSERIFYDRGYGRGGWCWD